ncbi:MAG: hypothetical protein JWM86_1685 [Thermoleophilia bacterium]|nr:hypothetical protein [Thermoleophilia bacterium]
MRSDPIQNQPPLAGTGLCAHCVHQRIVTSGRGSRFSLCERALEDPAFAKYPALPVLACLGFVLAPDQS